MTAESVISWAASAPVSTGTVRITAGSSEGCASGQQLRTGTATGLSRLQLGWELFAYGRRCRARRPLQNQLSGAAPGLTSWHRNAGEGWSIEPGIVDVVKADHADIRADVATQIRDCIEDAECDHVAEADNAIDIG